LTNFEALELIEPLLRAVQQQGYTEPTPIQQQAIPHVLQGKDLIGLAQTGTGKTAAFALPTLQRLMAIKEAQKPKDGRRIRRPRTRVLVLAPTRELASQIGDSFNDYGRFLHVKQVTVYGGVSINPQIKRLRDGADVIIATPGRLLDLMQRGDARLQHLELLILDEADRMLDMGFMPDIERILAELPVKRQTLLFSATMPPDIHSLTQRFLHEPVEVAVTPESTTVEAIRQQVFFVEKSNKTDLLRHLLRENSMHRTLVFTRTKHGANRLAQKLSRARVSAEAIHGDKSQRARETALGNFRKGKIQVLVATDIAARGIDVDDISHVVNFDLPNETESYVHRIGRTARAGAEGIALSFCAQDERKHLRDIERLIQMHLPIDGEHPYLSEHGMPEPTDLTGKRRSGSSTNRNRSGGRNRNNRRRSGGRNRRSDNNGNSDNNNSRPYGGKQRGKKRSNADNSQHGSHENHNNRRGQERVAKARGESAS
jgi:ATP-dependent RNA helicase RhlE